MLAYKSTSEVVYFPDYKSVLEKKNYLSLGVSS